MTTQTDSGGWDLETLSEKIHHLYCTQYLKDHGKPYWTGGDYSKLDERTKEYDRNIARFVMEEKSLSERQGAERAIAFIKANSTNDGDKDLPTWSVPYATMELADRTQEAEGKDVKSL